MRTTRTLSELLAQLAAAPAASGAWPAGPAPGERVDRYAVIRELRRDGLGPVLEAHDTAQDRRVLLRAVQPAPGAPPECLEQARALARLAHPNLLAVLDLGRCARGPYVVQELLPGVTLQERLSHGPLSVPEALRVALEVARGLAHAHAQGLVHRRLTPGHVLLGEGGLVKLLELGLAHAFGRPRLADGAPAYVAPEQWRGAPEDERTDVFALGVLLHAMLAGAPPHPEGGRGLSAERAPTVQVPDLPALGPLVTRMLERDPVRRPRDAGEVAAALATLQAELQRSRTGSRAGSRTVTVSYPPRRRRALAVAGLLCALLGAGAAAGWRWSRAAAPAAEGPPGVAVLPFSSLSAAREDAWFAQGVHGELITQLTKIAGLRVIARGSVLPYAGQPRDLPAVAAALGVRAVVEGTVQRDGARVRVTAHLLDPRSGTELWADRFDRRVDDVFALQTELALEIARNLGARLSPAERALVARAPTRDAEAHDLYRRALYFRQRSIGVQEDNDRAADLLGQALSRDGGFAAARALRATIRSEQGACRAAREDLARALAVQPDLPQAAAAQGDLRWNCDHDAAGAAEAYGRAVRGAPGDADAQASLGWLLTLVGRQAEGIDHLSQAAALDPRSFWVNMELASELGLARRHGEAAAACARAQALEPGDLFALASCALVPFRRQGDLEPARAAAESLPRGFQLQGEGAAALFRLLTLVPERTARLLEEGRLPDPISAADPLIPRALLEGCVRQELGQAPAARAAFAAALPALEREAARATASPFPHLLLARAHAGLGHAEEALRVARRAAELTREAQRRGLLLEPTAEIAAAAGRPGEALAALREALARPDAGTTPASLRADPRFAALRGDPAFAALADAPPAPGGPLSPVAR